MLDRRRAHRVAPDRAEFDRFVTTPCASASPKHTRPSGLCSDPPGPAMPVTATASPAPDRFKAPSAISRATASDTAPCASSVSAAPQHLDLGGVGIGHEPAVHHGGRPRHRGQRGHDHAARAAFRRRQHHALRACGVQNRARAHAPSIPWLTTAATATTSVASRPRSRRPASRPAACASGRPARPGRASRYRTRGMPGMRRDPTGPERGDRHALHHRAQRHGPERDPHAHHFVDDNLGRVGVGPPRVSAIVAHQPRANRERRGQTAARTRPGHASPSHRAGPQASPMCPGPGRR